MNIATTPPLDSHSDDYTSDPHTRGACEALVDDHVEVVCSPQIIQILCAINEVGYYIS